MCPWKPGKTAEMTTNPGLKEHWQKERERTFIPGRGTACTKAEVTEMSQHLGTLQKHRKHHEKWLEMGHRPDHDGYSDHTSQLAKHSPSLCLLTRPPMQFTLCAG